MSRESENLAAVLPSKREEESLSRNNDRLIYAKTMRGVTLKKRKVNGLIITKITMNKDISSALDSTSEERKNSNEKKLKKFELEKES